MQKIQMKTPLVEMDGDEMTRILWQMIKDELILPFVDLKTEYYDLSLVHREETKDQVTIDAANANKKYGVSVKCATITPNRQRVEEYHLSEMWKSPNGTIRAILDGTVFRAPILIDAVKPAVRNWEKPITIARHAYGDVYKATEYRVPGKGKAELLFTGEDGETFRKTVYDFECARRAAGAVQQRRVHRIVRAFVLPVRDSNQAGSVVFHQRHHFQTVRPDVQGCCLRTFTNSTTKRSLSSWGLNIFTR